MTAQSERLSLDFGGEWYYPEPSTSFTIGRDADLVIDDNPYLHRRLATITHEAGVWWLANSGATTGLSLSAGSGEYQAWVGPGVRVPLVFGRLTVVFTAGAYTYELVIHVPQPAWHEFASRNEAPVGGEATRGHAELTESQRLLVIALAEPLLKEPGAGVSSIPSSTRAAERLGWPLTTFNRKLDAVCDKLDRFGVPGLRGEPGNVAINRKARLVEHAVLARVVTAEDLRLLDVVARHARTPSSIVTVQRGGRSEEESP